MASSAAPNVDLRSQGLPKQALLALVPIVVTLFLYRSMEGSGSSVEEAGEEAASTLWMVWIFNLCLSVLYRLVQFALGVMLIVLVMLVSRQRSILYVPVPPGTTRSPGDNPPLFRNPAAWRLPYEDVWVTAEDGTRTHAWLVYQPRASCTAGAPFTFLYLHGNAGNIGHRLENIHDMHRRLGVNVLILDYRGYGDSEDGGGPCQAGFLKDATAAYRWLESYASRCETDGTCSTLISTERILFFGRSIGGAVSVHLFAQLLEAKHQAESKEVADKPLPAGLILENTFTSLRDMALQLFPFLQPLKFLLRKPLVLDEWLSVDRLEYIASTHQNWCCCLLSGLQDQIVPPDQMRQIHAVLKLFRPQVLKFFRFPNGGHNDTPTRGGEDYWVSFNKFMDLVRESEPDRLKALAGPNESTIG